MYQNNIKLPRNLLYVEELFKFLEIKDFEVYISNEKDFDFLLALEILAGKQLNVVFFEENSVCPLCNSRSNNNGRRIRYINRNKPVKIQKYVCSNVSCGKFHETNIEKIVPKNCNYVHKLRNEVIEQLLIDYTSFEKISEQINRIYDCKPSRQTILNHLKESYKNHYENTIEKTLKYGYEDLSGVYGYDEQYLRVNGDIRVRLSLLDLNTHVQLNQLIVKEFDMKIVENFIKSTLKGKKLDAIVTDGLTGYSSIIEDLTAKHQLCTFHIMHKLMLHTIEKVNPLKRRIKNLKKRITNLTKNLKENKYMKNKKTKIKQIKELKREIGSLTKKQKEWEHYVKRISNIFKSKTSNGAKMRISILLNNINHLPPLIGRIIHKLNKIFDKIINHIENDNIPSTNNKKERHFGITLPGYLKNRYRTDLGLEIHLKIAEYRWNQRNKKSVTF